MPEQEKNGREGVLEKVGQELQNDEHGHHKDQKKKGLLEQR